MYITLVLMAVSLPANVQLGDTDWIDIFLNIHKA